MFSGRNIDIKFNLVNQILDSIRFRIIEVGGADFNQWGLFPAGHKLFVSSEQRFEKRDFNSLFIRTISQLDSFKAVLGRIGKINYKNG